MITRIEIDGFKSFRDFTLDVPPLLVLAGPTAGGKSNLLDAVDYEAAARAGRPGAGGWRGGAAVPQRGRAGHLMSRPPAPGSSARDRGFDHMRQNVDLKAVDLKAVEGLGWL